MAKLTKRARIVLSELASLSRASNKHLEFVADYSDVLLNSLNKAEQRKLKAYLKRKHDMDLSPEPVRARTKRLRQLETKLETLQDKIDDLQARLENAESRYINAYWPNAKKREAFARKYIYPIERKIDELLRVVDELEDQIETMEESI